MQSPTRWTLNQQWQILIFWCRMGLEKYQFPEHLAAKVGHCICVSFRSVGTLSSKFTCYVYQSTNLARLATGLLPSSVQRLHGTVYRTSPESECYWRCFWALVKDVCFVVIVTFGTAYHFFRSPIVYNTSSLGWWLCTTTSVGPLLKPLVLLLCIGVSYFPCCLYPQNGLGFNVCW